MVAFAELTVLLSFSLSFSVVPGRRRAGCHGPLRGLWSSWYASLSAPLSAPWLRAALSGRGRENAYRRRRQGEDRRETGSKAVATALLPS